MESLVRPVYPGSRRKENMKKKAIVALALSLVLASTFFSTIVAFSHAAETVEIQIDEVPKHCSTRDIQIYWSNDHCRDDPKYPFGGQFHNGEYPVWKNFTVVNSECKRIVYVAIQYPETTPNFKPSEYQCEVCQEPELENCELEDGWTINVNLADRLIEFFACDRCDGGIPPLTRAIFSVYFEEGPTEEDCDEGHEFAVTVSTGCCGSKTEYLDEYIDQTPPTVTITFPVDEDPGGESYAFVKKNGFIQDQTPECEVEDVHWLWINGTANDTCSGINRVEIWINGTYVGDAELSEPHAREVSWWWYTDPTKPEGLIPDDFWQPESWYYVVARAYDDSVHNTETIPHGSRIIPRTYSSDTPENWFFWIGQGDPILQLQDKPFEQGGKILSWTPGNGGVGINGTTGWYPNGRVDIWLESQFNSLDPYNIRIHLANVTADHYGRFYKTIHHLPEVPRKQSCTDHWIIRAIDNKGNNGADHLAIVPWITYEDTITMEDARDWDTTEKGNVGQSIRVYGHGFLPSRQPTWNPTSNINIQVIYTDVAPLLARDQRRRVFNGTGEFNWDNLEWQPMLSTNVLTSVTTDENGYWSAQITIPQSYGGLHAIYAREICPPQLQSCTEEVSGWPSCTIQPIDFDKEAQAVIFDVWPTINIHPNTAITSQYVNITAEGLPLPKHYRLWINGSPVIEDRDWCLALDFGPFRQRVNENLRIRNDEFDQSWAMGMWYPFSFYWPDPVRDPDNLVWHGKLCSTLFDWNNSNPESERMHLGSRFLKVPMLSPEEYDVTVYYFDKNTERFTYDHSNHTGVNVIKDPMHVNLEVGTLHYPEELVNAFIEIDVDGTVTDASVLTLALYKGQTFMKMLSYNRICEGRYTTTFKCPDEGDYFIQANAAKGYDSISLYESDIKGFTVTTSTTLDATLVGIEDDMATILIEVGEIKVDLGLLDTATIKGLYEDVLIIGTVIGDIESKLEDVNGFIEIEHDVAKIKTDLGEVTGKVKGLEGTLFTIETDIGTIKTKANIVKGGLSINPASVIISLVTALATVAVATLIFKKVT